MIRISWAAIPLLLTASASAQLTWYVSSIGSDSNGCTVQSPCRTIQRTNFQAGDTVYALDSGDFALGNTITLNYGAILDGGPKGAVLNGPETGPVINIQTNTPGPGNTPVVIRNMTIMPGPGANYAITGQSGTVNTPGVVILDHVTIQWISNTVGSMISLVSVPGSTVIMRDVTIRGSGAGGIFLYNSTSFPIELQTPAPFNVFMDHVEMSQTSTGVWVEDANVTIQNSNFEQNTTGLQCHYYGIPSNWTLENVAITGATTGLEPSAGCTIRLSNSSFTNNTTGIGAGGTVISLRNNLFSNNVTDGAPSLSTSFK